MEYSDGHRDLDAGIGGDARFAARWHSGTQTAWENLVHPDDRPEVLQLVKEALKTGRPMQGEWCVVWPDRSVRWIAGRWQVLMNDSGEPLRMVGVNVDITERKLAEQELARANEQPFRL